MRRIECLERLAPLIESEFVVVGLTGTNWEWRNLSRYDGNIFIGSLGHATAVGCGMAIAMPHRSVVVLDSDGSALFDLPALSVIGTYKPPNLSVFVFDNEVYSGSRISEPTATATGTNLELMARAAGIEHTATVSDLNEFEDKIANGLMKGHAEYIVVKVTEDTDSRMLPKPRMDYMENMYQFIRNVERTEGRVILPELR